MRLFIFFLFISLIGCNNRPPFNTTQIDLRSKIPSNHRILSATVQGSNILVCSEDTTTNQVFFYTVYDDLNYNNTYRLK